MIGTWAARLLAGVAGAGAFCSFAAAAHAASAQAVAVEPLQFLGIPVDFILFGLTLYPVRSDAVGGSIRSRRSALRLGGLLATAPLRRPDWEVMPETFKGAVFLLALVISASLVPVEKLPAAAWQLRSGWASSPPSSTTSLSPRRR